VILETLFQNIGYIKYCQEAEKHFQLYHPALVTENTHTLTHSPIFEMNNMSPLKSSLKEVAKFLFLCCDRARLWTAVLNASTKSLKTGHVIKCYCQSLLKQAQTLSPSDFLLLIQLIQTISSKEAQCQICYIYTEKTLERTVVRGGTSAPRMKVNRRTLAAPKKCSINTAAEYKLCRSPRHHSLSPSLHSPSLPHQR